jgi:hypothetical protein
LRSTWVPGRLTPDLPRGTCAPTVYIALMTNNYRLQPARKQVIQPYKILTLWDYQNIREEFPPNRNELNLKRNLVIDIALYTPFKAKSQLSYASIVTGLFVDFGVSPVNTHIESRIEK